MDHDERDQLAMGDGAGREPLPAPVASAPGHAPSPAPYRRKVVLPIVLFLATIVSTFLAGYHPFVDGDGERHEALEGGLLYCGALMTILTAHELGHFFQAVRYGVPASFPFFIPMPISPIGTMGAVIAMRAHFGNRKSLYDIGITGPVAGLIPAIGCCVWGIAHSRVVDLTNVTVGERLGEPLLFSWLALWLKGPLATNQEIVVHPVAFAGWVGLLITSLNLLPIGQLDGGHILYALLRRYARRFAILTLLGAIVAIAFGYTMWAPFVILLCLMGPSHPPTADDSVPLGWPRIILGWLMLAFVPIGFTPVPFMMP